MILLFKTKNYNIMTSNYYIKIYSAFCYLLFAMQEFDKQCFK